jgi:DNA-binding NtrC family response regulator
VTGPRRQNMQILVVDDEKDMCWALQRIIEAEGHRAWVAHDAAAARQLLRHISFDLCLVDAKLPDMEGTDLIDRLHGVCPALPCVLVSGYLYVDDEIVQAGLRSGRVATFIGKPFLLAEVRDALRLAHPALGMESIP